jgi:RHS repeat-associated protein
MKNNLVLLAFLGALGAVSAVHAGTQTRTSAFEYDATSGLLIKEIIEPDDPDLCLVTTYTYDGFGNKTDATTRNCSGSSGEASAPTGDAVFETRTSSTSFAATTVNPTAGQFPTLSSNALTHDENKEFDARFGAVTKLIGPNDLTTTWAYDGFGRKTLETRADGTTTAWSYARCVDSPGTCPTYGVMFVTVTATGSPQSRQFTDSLGRELRSETQGFDGTWVRRDTQYDALGRVAQVSKPYKAGDTVHWTTFAYDILGRPIEANEPSVAGNAVRTTTTYNALVTTVTVSNAGGGTNMPGGVVQTKTTTKNSQGQVVEVKDAQNNTVTYSYDPFGNLLTTNAGGVTTTLAYDLRGRKTSMADPDMGSWSYFYNALGELIRQTDAKSQTTAMAYDKLGRMTTRTEPDLVSTWTYDSCTKGVGKLCSAGSDNGYARTHTYDTLGRPTSLAVTVDTSYTVSTTYVASGADAGKVDTITYPTGYAVKNVYNSYGYLWKVQRTNDADTTVYWEANAQDAAGHVTSELLGNGLTQTRSYDALFRMTAITASNTGGAVHNLTYAFDTIGNVTQRTDVTQSVTESFAYDVLNRLVQASGSGPTLPLTTRSFDYNAVGNMTYKSDVGAYTYPALTAARPHAVSSVDGGGVANSVTASYTYDANGNLSASSGTIYPGASSVSFSRTLTYTSFNMPNALTHVQGSATYSYTYTYNAEHERVKLVTVRPTDTLTSVYVHPAGKGALMYEKETRASDGLVEHKHYVNGGAGLIGVFVTKSTYAIGQGPEMRYYHKDHLGSVVAITNGSAGVIERLAYEAFGERRFTNGIAQDRSSPLFGVATDRGYTAHEHLDEMNLIHMNGRIYDPVLGRFMTADILIDGPSSLQGYNRYSYVHNNPLMYTDPSGHLSLKKLFKAVVVAVAAYYTAGMASTWLATSGSTWAVATGTMATEFGVATYTTMSVAGAAAAGAAGGFASGFVGSGGDMEGGFRGAIFGGAFAGISTSVTGAAPSYDLRAESVARVAGKQAMNAVLRDETDRFFERRFGLTGLQLDLTLMGASFAGDEIFGSRYHGSSGSHEHIGGVAGRDRLGFNGRYNVLSAPAEFVDIALMTRGLPTASGLRYLAYGDRGLPLVGYSLGAGDVNTLASYGLGSTHGNYAISLPALQVGAQGNNVTLGSRDPVNLGGFGRILSPGASVEDRGFADHVVGNYRALQHWRGGGAPN